ncbi:hypothetical protein scyTo_0020563 [Scyliorhinus torazame]|uniref:Uncharacterized protein n=1 Tax=Scyliorhinus torazame TaxID=75743 RepID=A0A401PW51_SCYTO|nr:hypothetical protein [Scyliorhinus torazame]
MTGWGVGGGLTPLLSPGAEAEAGSGTVTTRVQPFESLFTFDLFLKTLLLDFRKSDTLTALGAQTHLARIGLGGSVSLIILLSQLTGNAGKTGGFGEKDKVSL